MSKTFLYQVIQFSQTVLIQSMQFSSIYPIDRALSGATILGQSGPGSNAKGCSTFPKAPALLEPHHQIV